MTIYKAVPATIYAIFMLIIVVSSGAAARFPHPTVDFSADTVMTIQQAGSNQPYVIQGKLFSSNGKERREISSFGRKTATIKHRDKDQMWTLMPEQKMYMINQHPQARKDPEQMIRDGELKITRVGAEKVNGQTTTKYKVESTEKGKDTFSGFAWLNKQNIPLRFEGTASTDGMKQDITIEYSNIVVARQDPQLFDVPADYRPMNMGFGSAGTPGKNLTPEQIEQMMKMIKQQQSAE
jgi:hypothetical protein